MEHYNVFIGLHPNNIRYVDIHQILMTKPISDATKLFGLPSPRGFKIDPGPHGFPLHKIKSVHEAMLSQIKLPPIIIKYIATCRNTQYFSIIDGRHRFACSIIFSFPTIPVIIQ